MIPTNSAEKTNIVLKAGQRVMVLKSPKGIYMQLESGKIIAIKTSLKGLAGGQKSDGKDNSPVGKKGISFVKYFLWYRLTTTKPGHQIIMILFCYSFGQSTDVNKHTRISEKQFGDHNNV